MRVWHVCFLAVLVTVLLQSGVLQQGGNVAAADQQTIARQPAQPNVAQWPSKLIDEIYIDPDADFVVVANVSRLISQFPSASHVDTNEPISKCDNGTLTTGSVNFCGRLSFQPRESRDTAIVLIDMDGMAATRMQTRSGKISVALCGSASLVGSAELHIKYGHPTTMELRRRSFHCDADLRKLDVKILRRALAPGLLKRVASRVVHRKLPQGERDFCNELIANTEDGLVEEVRSLDIGSYQNEFEVEAKKLGFAPISVSTTTDSIVLQMNGSKLGGSTGSVSRYKLKSDLERKPLITAILSGNSLLKLTKPEAFQLDRNYEVVPLEDALASLGIISLYSDGGLDPVELIDPSFEAQVGATKCTLLDRSLFIRIPLNRNSKPWGAISLAYKFAPDGKPGVLPKGILSEQLTFEPHDRSDVSLRITRLEEQLNELAMHEPIFDLKGKLVSVMDSLANRNGENSLPFTLSVGELRFSEDNAWIEAQFTAN